MLIYIWIIWFSFFLFLYLLLLWWILLQYQWQWKKFHLFLSSSYYLFSWLWLFSFKRPVNDTISLCELLAFANYLSVLIRPVVEYFLASGVFFKILMWKCLSMWESLFHRFARLHPHSRSSQDHSERVSLKYFYYRK